MATSITLHQVCAVVPDDVYQVTSTITVAAGIPKELFLFSYATDEYQHVCLVSDLTAYPDTKTAGYDYYRQDEAVLPFTEEQIALAEETAQAIQDRLQELATQYETAKTDFIADLTVTYTG